MGARTLKDCQQQAWCLNVDTSIEAIKCAENLGII